MYRVEGTGSIATGQGKVWDEQQERRYYRSGVIWREGGHVKQEISAAVRF